MFGCCLFAEIPGKALMGALQMLTHRCARTGRIAVSDRIADCGVFLDGGMPSRVVERMARQPVEIRIDTQVEHLTNASYDDRIAERLGNCGMETSVGRKCFFAMNIQVRSFGQNLVDARDMLSRGVARRFFRDSTFNECPGLQNLKRPLYRR